MADTLTRHSPGHVSSIIDHCGHLSTSVRAPTAIFAAARAPGLVIVCETVARVDQITRKVIFSSGVAVQQNGLTPRTLCRGWHGRSRGRHSEADNRLTANSLPTNFERACRARSCWHLRARPDWRLERLLCGQPATVSWSAPRLRRPWLVAPVSAGRWARRT